MAFQFMCLRTIKIQTCIFIMNILLFHYLLFFKLCVFTYIVVVSIRWCKCIMQVCNYHIDQFQINSVNLTFKLNFMWLLYHCNMVDISEDLRGDIRKVHVVWGISIL